MTDTVFLDGRLQPRAEARISIDDRAFRYGEGVFETLRGRGRAVFRMDDHLGRLRASAAALGWELPWSDAEVREAVDATLGANSLPEARLRIQASRGPGGLDHADGPPTLLVEAAPFAQVPPALRQTGVDLVVSPYRRSSGGVAPSAKSSSYLLHLLARSRARSGGAYEALLCNEAGQVCEASTANLFALHGDSLVTPPTDSPVLAGITRAVVLELADGRSDLRAAEEAIRPGDLERADEVFLTSTGIEILPVRRVDERPVGGGTPGPTARSLLGAYRAVLDHELGTLPG